MEPKVGGGGGSKLTDVQKKDVSMAQPFAVSSVFLLFMIVLCGTPRRHKGPCSVSHASRPGCYLLCVQTKTAWDGKSTWINIYYGRCCSRQVLFRGNLPWPRWYYGNNPLTEVFLHSVWLQSSKKKKLHVGFSYCMIDTGNFQNKEWEQQKFTYSYVHFSSPLC